PVLVEQVFMLLVVLNLLAAFKTLGTLMAVGLMILPATAARYWSSTITGQLCLGILFALMTCWIGLTLSFLAPETPSGPSIVLVAGAIFLFSVAASPLGLRAGLGGGARRSRPTRSKGDN
ncbi:MAG: metal ABC transporter permease, partial [Pseudomonadota bacterium]